MAQSLSYTWSDVRLQPLHRSLSRTAVPRQIISFSAVKALHGPTPPLTTAHCAGVEQGSVPTSQGDTNFYGDSSAQSSTVPDSQVFSLGSIPTWAKVVLGSLAVLAIPFCSSIFKLRVMAKRVDSVVEVVHTVAEAAEKAAEELAEVLPEGDLKRAAIKLEKVAAFIDKNAEYTDAFFDKVNDVSEELKVKLTSLDEGKKSVAKKDSSPAKPELNDGHE